MLIIKRIDRFILRKFFLVFAASFFVCLFIFVMQFTWVHIDALIGKGLTMDILAKFYWYMAVALLPQSLPMAILLAALISFGNMGEQLELLAMKSAGIPLLRVMAPLAVCVTGMGLLSFYFQNVSSPNAQRHMRAALLSIKQSQPAVEIPEGVFYNGVPNINLYVQRKDVKTGMLYNIILYKTDQGFERAQIVLADSARLEMTADKLHLTLEMWNGEQFENLSGAGAQMMQANVPYDRETFAHKDFIIDFDTNFNELDAENMRSLPSAKSMPEIEATVDSMRSELDSMGHYAYAHAVSAIYELKAGNNAADSARVVKAAQAANVDFDTLVARLMPEERLMAEKRALSNVQSYKAELSWKKEIPDVTEYYIRRHLMEWHKKITLSLACIVFFFIGAPLGAVIRKGGLGMPAVVSVAFFVFYYIIDTLGYKMARGGTWNHALGTWISTIVLTPIAVVLTYKANKDSVAFNIDFYLTALKKFVAQVRSFSLSKFRAKTRLRALMRKVRNAKARKKSSGQSLSNHIPE